MDCRGGRVCRSARVRHAGEDYLRHGHVHGLRRRRCPRHAPRARRHGRVRDPRHDRQHARCAVRRHGRAHQRLLRPPGHPSGRQQGARHRPARSAPCHLRHLRRHGEGPSGRGEASLERDRARRERDLPQDPRRAAGRQRDDLLRGLHDEHAPPLGDEGRRDLAARRPRACREKGEGLVRDGVPLSRRLRVQLEGGRRVLEDRVPRLAHAHLLPRLVLRRGGEVRRARLEGRRRRQSRPRRLQARSHGVQGDREGACCVGRGDRPRGRAWLAALLRHCARQVRHRGRQGQERLDARPEGQPLRAHRQDAQGGGRQDRRRADGARADGLDRRAEPAAGGQAVRRREALLRPHARLAGGEQKREPRRVGPV